VRTIVSSKRWHFFKSLKCLSEIGVSELRSETDHMSPPRRGGSPAAMFRCWRSRGSSVSRRQALPGLWPAWCRLTLLPLRLHPKLNNLSQLLRLVDTLICQPSEHIRCSAVARICYRKMDVQYIDIFVPTPAFCSVCLCCT